MYGNWFIECPSIVFNDRVSVSASRRQTHDSIVISENSELNQTMSKLYLELSVRRHSTIPPSPISHGPTEVDGVQFV